LNIIEKLGIGSKYRNSMVNGDIILELEQQNNEMLEVLIKVSHFWDDHKFDTTGEYGEFNCFETGELDFVGELLEKVTGNNGKNIKKMKS